VPKEEDFFNTNIPVIPESSGTLGIVVNGATLDFTLDVMAFPLLIKSIKIVSLAAAPSANFDLWLWENADRDTVDNRGIVYENLGINSWELDRFLPDLIYRPSKQNDDMTYGDEIDYQTPMYFRIKNNDADSDFYIEVRYQVQGGPLNNDLSGAVPDANPVTTGV